MEAWCIRINIRTNTRTMSMGSTRMRMMISLISKGVNGSETLPSPPARCPRYENQRTYKAHFSSVAPLVKPAPTAASKTVSPLFSLPSMRAVSIASGMVPAVVLP